MEGLLEEQCRMLDAMLIIDSIELIIEEIDEANGNQKKHKGLVVLAVVNLVVEVLGEVGKIINMDYSKFYLFIRGEIGVVIDDKSPNYDIAKDFNLYGDEAVDFINKFSKEFNVNVEAFDFDKYFNSEVDSISLYIKNFFKKDMRAELTIEHLKRAIDFGMLF